MLLFPKFQKYNETPVEIWGYREVKLDNLLKMHMEKVKVKKEERKLLKKNQHHDILQCNIYYSILQTQGN